MAGLPLNEPAGVLVKTTCVDFPGHVAGSFFLKGCNLRCPYCYNTGLVLGKKELDAYNSSIQNANGDSPQNLSQNLIGQNTIEELFNHLEKRQGILDGVVISGGEPLLNPYTPLIIKKAKELGYAVKLDTNGTLPDELEFFVNNRELRPDFIAMDLKTSPARYSTTVCNKISKFYGNAEYFEKKVTRAAQIVASFPPECREWRTVLVPSLVAKGDIPQMAAILPKDASWQFAQFQNGNCIDPSYNEITPYIDSEINEIIETAKKLIPGASLR